MGCTSHSHPGYHADAMSVVWVQLEDAQRGSIPARCARSGQRCITRWSHPVAELPAVLEWATWTRLWPRNRARVPQAIVLPTLPTWHRVDTTLRLIRDATAGVFVVALIAMLFTPTGLADRAATYLTLASLVIHVLAGLLGLLLTVDARLDSTGTWVRLSGVHRDFVTATESLTARPSLTPSLPGDAVATSAAAQPSTGDPAKGS